MTPTHATQDKAMSTTKLMKGTKSHGVKHISTRHAPLGETLQFAGLLRFELGERGSARLTPRDVDF